MKIGTFILIVALISFSCNQNKGRWVKFPARNLRTSNEGFAKMLFIDSLNGFLFGDYTSDEAFEQKQFLTATEAVLYKTNDAGRSWKRTTLGRGRFKDAFVLNSIIYAVKDSFSAADSAEHKKVYASVDKGKSWSLQPQSTNSVQAIVSSTSQRTALLGDTFYTINLYRDSLLAFIPATARSVFVPLPAGYKPQLIAVDKGSIWLAGYHHNDIALLEHHPTGTRLIPITELKNKTALITAFHVADGSISMITADEGTILGATHKFFRSLDRGRTWSREELPDDLYTQPVAFWGREMVWTYCGSGSVQRRK